MCGCQDVRIPDGSEGMGNSVGVSLSMDTAFALHLISPCRVVLLLFGRFYG